MKTIVIIFAFIIACFAGMPSALSHELPLFGELPNLTYPDVAESWTLYKKEAKRQKTQKGFYTQSWTIFTDTENGGVLSFYEIGFGDQPYPEAVLGGYWTEMAISTFPGGYQHGNQPPGVNITRGEGSTSKLVKLSKAIKSVASTAYWKDESGALLLAHSHAFALGNQMMFVQHTSTKITTPEFVEGIAKDLIYHHYNSERKTHTEAQQGGGENGRKVK